MGSYVSSIKIGLIIFPILALLITVPYMIYQYHKYGSIPYLKTIIVYSFVLYLLEAYFMVILPLPKINTVKYSTRDWAQLVPFNFITEISNKINFNPLSLSSYIKFIKHPLVYQLLFNIFLTVPFGIYLRYYFKRSLKEIIILSFILSLFFEFTQITGLYGLYPRPYRVFDVDDLIANTLGGTLGYLLTPLFTFFLPTKEELDKRALEDSLKVSFPRKLIGNIIDFSLVYLIFSLIVRTSIKHEFLLFSLMLLIYYILCTYLFRGYTPGKFIVRIKLVNEGEKRVKFYQLLLRYQVIFILFFEVFYFYYYFKIKYVFTLLIILTFIIYLGLFINFLRKKTNIYEKISKTKHISTKV